MKWYLVPSRSPPYTWTCKMFSKWVKSAQGESLQKSTLWMGWMKLRQANKHDDRSHKTLPKHHVRRWKLHPSMKLKPSKLRPTLESQTKSTAGSKSNSNAKWCHQIFLKFELLTNLESWKKRFLKINELGNQNGNSRLKLERRYLQIEVIFVLSSKLETFWKMPIYKPSMNLWTKFNLETCTSRRFSNSKRWQHNSKLDEKLSQDLSWI